MGHESSANLSLNFLRFFKISRPAPFTVLSLRSLRLRLALISGFVTLTYDMYSLDRFLKKKKSV